MQKVLEYELTDRKTELSMPRGSKLLSVQYKKGVACLWAVCYPADPPVKRTFIQVHTDEAIPSAKGTRLDYVDTYQLEPFAIHVFEQSKF